MAYTHVYVFCKFCLWSTHMHTYMYTHSVTPSVITTQPSDQLDVNAATDVTFMVAATGGFGMSYQWQKDGVFLTDTPFKYTGANSNTLTVINVHNPTDEGSYSVIVSNNEPTSVTSDDAMLTIGE